jgi:Tfp pilus assembly PilM family ATPase
MPPFYDIYGFSKHRDKQTIEKFLTYFCCRDKIENVEGQEIAIYHNDKYKVEEQFIPGSSLTEVIEFGIKYSNYGFAFYIGTREHYEKDINGVILKFTFDGNIIFGISVEEQRLNEQSTLIDNYDKAVEIEKRIAELTNSVKSSIQLENAPSDDEEEFNLEAELWRNMIEVKRTK